MSKLTKSKARTANFQEAHTLEYALTITEHQLNPPESDIIDALSLLYIYRSRNQIKRDASKAANNQRKGLQVVVISYRTLQETSQRAASRGLASISGLILGAK